jgi:hypothetical protein
MLATIAPQQKANNRISPLERVAGITGFKVEVWLMLTPEKDQTVCPREIALRMNGKTAPDLPLING